MPPLDRLTLLLATGLGIGRLPASPGTFGSLWGLVIAWGLERATLPTAGYAAVVTGLLAAGVPICGRAARLLQQSDPGPVVYDEFAALPLAYIAVPFTGPLAVAGFVLFRMLDIWKPGPIRRLERLPGGWGIMADDVASALLTAVLLWTAVHVSGT